MMMMMMFVRNRFSLSLINDPTLENDLKAATFISFFSVLILNEREETVVAQSSSHCVSVVIVV